MVPAVVATLANLALDTSSASSLSMVSPCCSAARAGQSKAAQIVSAPHCRTPNRPFCSTLRAPFAIPGRARAGRPRYRTGPQPTRIDERPMDQPLLPVTVLTGFLGAGKTTLLNRILAQPHGQRIAVIENEFGPEGVDHELLVTETREQIVEMNNGCLCCSVRGDLVRILGELRDKRVAGQLQFDRVIVETTGMANPGPVTQTFFIEDGVAGYYRLDGVITVVDAKHGHATLDQQPEAQSQVGFADRILLSKADLVEPGEIDSLRARLVRMNPRAPIRTVQLG